MVDKGKKTIENARVKLENYSGVLKDDTITTPTTSTVSSIDPQITKDSKENQRKTVNFDGSVTKPHHVGKSIDGREFVSRDLSNSDRHNNQDYVENYEEIEGNSDHNIDGNDHDGGDGDHHSQGGCQDGIAQGSTEFELTSWKLTQPVLGGPINIDLLYGFGGHVAYGIWRNQERGVLTCHTRWERLKNWLIIDQQVLELVNETRLAHLSKCIFKHMNMPLISAFVERWYPETNSFHMPFGEMTITLHDVYYILRIPVHGKAVAHTETKESVIAYVATQLGLDVKVVEDEWKKGMRFDTLFKQCKGNLHATNLARGYLLYLLGATLFVDKTRVCFSAQFAPLLANLQEVPNYAWGAATLALVYRQLGMASRAGCKQLAGCTTLVEAWIYEYFSMFKPSQHTSWTPQLPRVMRWRIDKASNKNNTCLLDYRRRLDEMTPDQVQWTPYGANVASQIQMTLFHGCLYYGEIVEPYMPDRVLRQFGYVQSIPNPPIRPSRCSLPINPASYVIHYESYKSNWCDYTSHILSKERMGAMALEPWQTSQDYMQWFLPRTHQRVQNRLYMTISSLPIASEMTAEARLQLIRGHARRIHPDRRHGLTIDEILSHVDSIVEVALGEEEIIDNGNEEDGKQPISRRKRRQN